MSDFIPLDQFSTETLALTHAAYVRAVCGRGDPIDSPLERIKESGFEFQIPREILIDELARMTEWLKTSKWANGEWNDLVM